MIYLDNNATTKPFPEVIDVMIQFMSSRFWNASSACGQLDDLEGVVESAKQAVRRLSGAGVEDEIIFTSGATESNAWAVAEGARRTLGIGWALSAGMEHPSVRESMNRFRKEGLQIRWVPVNHDGSFDLERLTEIVDPDLRFVSLMLAHNETGVIQPLESAVKLIREQSPGCLIHTDATQAIGKIPLSFSSGLEEIDLVSFSGHKFHGPKGIGGLIIRNSTTIQPLIPGGGQQNSLRSGTMNIPAIAGISAAANKCSELLELKRHEVTKTVRDGFEELLFSHFPSAFALGTKSPRLPNTSFFGIEGTDADDLVHALAANGIAVSKGSACSAQSIEPSKTALLMGYSHNEASSLIRFAASFDTTLDEARLLISKLNELCGA